CNIPPIWTDQGFFESW
nr:immunoglobulin heavy chain junction region [Macaca mulatta]MOV47720.1 immunoglobulin heavy chain junction region [Macaca mulatta]MOV47964.1 immunoglobulin heavy chain junction region [Macaca mulatta]MOV47983.1 immunoglobulin heavy chain junction region [Macaca mulatta]MOV48010.1 immunoglobulin heavy chain junction region [Macaca mulatta]